MVDLVPVSTLTVMLIVSLTLLVVTQLPSTMSSRRPRILIGLTSSVVLGLGILILKGVLPLFACILSIIAVLPKMRLQAPLIIGCVLALAHVSRRLIVDDLSDYYSVIQVNAKFPNESALDRKDLEREPRSIYIIARSLLCRNSTTKKKSLTTCARIFYFSISL